MPTESSMIDSLEILVVFEKKQLKQSVVNRVVEAFPQAKLFVGPALGGRPGGLVGLCAGLERRLFPYPGRLSEPMHIRRLPADLPIVDVIVDLRPGGPDPGLVGQARSGLWRLGRIDDGAAIRGDDALTVPLIRHSSTQQTGHLVAQVRVQSKLLIERTGGFATEKAIQLIRRELARLALTRKVANIGPEPSPPAPARNADLPGYFRRILSEFLRRAATKLRGGMEKGRIFALRIGEGSPEDFDPGRGRDIPNPHAGWRADPFLLEHRGALYCFFEDLPPRQGNAHVSVARWSKTDFQVLGPALQTDYHLSYPFVFEHEGEVYMLPETLGTERIEMWKATEFPQGWKLYATALEGQRFADPVLFKHQDAWWLFASPCHDSIDDFSSELWLFKADGPALTRLEPHLLNPVVVGSDTARGGGRVISSQGRLFRLSQDNSGNSYGYGLNVMEITELSLEDYQETRMRHITPADIPGVIGCHHADFSGERFVIDLRWP